MPRSRLQRRQDGATAVEFAIIAPLLLLMLFGIIEFGRYISLTTSVRAAAREAARYGSVSGEVSAGVPRYADCAGIRAAAKKAVKLQNLSDSAIVVSYDHGPGSAPHATCPAGGSMSGQLAAGDRILVDVTAGFVSTTPLIGRFLDGRDIQSSDRRSVFP